MAVGPRDQRVAGNGLGGVVAALSDGIVVVDRHGRIRFANPAACRLFGRSLTSLLGADFGHPLRTNEPTEIELLVNGVPRVVEMRTNVGRWGGQGVVVVALRDVTVRARALAESEEAARQALHDPLTGLPNRALLLDRIRQALARSERSQGSLAVMFVDADFFKQVNDRAGHDAGDRVLREMARRLQAAVRPTDTVCRLGGDEFVIVCQDLEGRTEAEEIANRVESAVTLPYPVDGTELVVTVSVGIAMADAGASPEALLSAADAAMYQAKQEGRARHRLFDETMQVQVGERSRLEDGLRAAMEGGGLRLVYQPVFTLASAEITGVEAFLRYDDPDRGELAAERFIDVAEVSGLVVPMGTWALEQACREAAGWCRLGWPMPVAVNLAAAQLAAPDFEPTVRAALAQAALPPEMLCLEITERVVAEAGPAALGAVDALTAAGVRLGLDDWGGGLASVTALAHLPADYVKLDRSVLAELGASHRTADALVGAAVALGLLPLAKGIESDEQRQLAQAVGCAAGQGHHLAAPEPPERLLARHGSKPEG